MLNLAVIAAGEGSRLKSEGIGVSKPLVKVGGVSLLERIINAAIKNGCETVNCIINENSDDLKKFLTENDFGVSVNLIVKTTESSLHSLYELSKITDSPFLLTTADSVFDENEFSEFVNFADKSEADAVFAVTGYVDDEKPLYVDVDRNGIVKGFYDDNRGFEFVSGGMYFFKRSIKKEAEEAVASGISRMRNFQRFLIEKGFKIEAFVFSKIIDVDHTADIKTAEEFLNN